MPSAVVGHAATHRRRACGVVVTSMLGLLAFVLGLTLAYAEYPLPGAAPGYAG